MVNSAGTKKPSIPSWQRASPPTSSTEQSISENAAPKGATDALESEGTTPTENEGSSGEPESQSPPLIEQARMFLQDPKIKDESHERKTAFLQSKGITAETIQALLSETESAPDASSAAKPLNLSSPPTFRNPKDVPPIVTYPEFLTANRRAKPAPLMTFSRFLTTIYLSAGASATLYAASKYLLAPMAAELAAARHDLSAHTQTHLDALNARLLAAASRDPGTTHPATRPASRAATTDHDADADSASSVFSDPAEPYHRDFGTQTTPTLSRRPSTEAASSEEGADSAEGVHAARLRGIAALLGELDEAAEREAGRAGGAAKEVKELATWLNEVRYRDPYYGGPGGRWTFGGAEEGKKDGGKADAVEELKAEIRGVKGVFLSARNFPKGQGTGMAAVGVGGR